MARRKQEPIFSRLKLTEAQSPPEKRQVKDLARKIAPLQLKGPPQRVEDTEIERDRPGPRDLGTTFSAGPLLVDSPMRPRAGSGDGPLHNDTPVDPPAGFRLKTCRDKLSGKISGELFTEGSFVLITPGTFAMGSPEYETGRSSDEIAHEVILTKGFYMQVTPVTQGQWEAVMGGNPSSFLYGGGACPVESISWDECRQFIRRLNAENACTYRLPTEAEWEYACRAGGSTPFYNGEISELCCVYDPLLSEAGWYCGNSGRKSRPVAQKVPNAWGLYDMHGNVSEWCQDWYGEYGSGSQTDPCGPKSGSVKVIRGGSWLGNAKNCRSASRFYWLPNSRSECIGFRLVREI